MRLVNVYPGSVARKNFFPTNTATTCAPKTLVQNRPAVNILETEDDFQIQLAAPGLNKEDFVLEVENDVLTISAKKVAEQKEGEKYTRHEFSYGEFTRKFNLPETIDNQGISANFVQGILTVTLAKKQEAKPQPARKIDIV